MPTTQALIVDGRSFRYGKNMTERRAMMMGNKTLTLKKYTDTSKTLRYPAIMAKAICSLESSQC
jgi:hypothetical protein